MFETLRADMSRAMRETRNDPDWTPTWRNKVNVAIRHATWPVIAYRYGHWTLGVRIPVIGQLPMMLVRSPTISGRVLSSASTRSMPEYQARCGRPGIGRARLPSADRKRVLWDSDR